MKIDGKAIANEIKKDLIKQVEKLKSRNISPHLAVILIGNDPASATYVKRKEMLAKEIGARISIFKFSYEADNLKDTSGVARRIPPTCLPARQGWRKQKEELLNLVNNLNQDKSIHGIIIQRPVPLSLTNKELNNLVETAKDVDGFHPNSLFDPPVATAVMNILNYVFLKLHPKLFTQKFATAKICDNNNLMKWLDKKKVLIIGRGETAGKPIANTFSKLRIKFEVAHSKTKNLKDLCLKADIIISCVGKSNIVRQDFVTDKTILIGVGLHPENEKLKPDYIQEEIAKRTAFYTPVPGGVGPVNVACLFANLLQAVNIQSD